MDLEIRAAVELRTAGRTLAGHAAVWDRPTLIGGRFTETVRRGAFTAHLAGTAETWLLAHHDFTAPLGRTGNRSLILSEDDIGLAFEATLPETRAADEVLTLTRAGILTGASFAFRVPAGGDVWSNGRERRELRQIDLVEISAVTVPAYPDAKISARSLGHDDAARRLRYRLALL